MTLLRSRKIPPPKHTPKTLKTPAKPISIEPATPAQTREPAQSSSDHSPSASPGDSLSLGADYGLMNRRRSLRLAALKSSTEEPACTPIDGRSRKRKSVESNEIMVSEKKKEAEAAKGKGKLNVANATVVGDGFGGLLDGDKRVLRSGKRVPKSGTENEDGDVGVVKEISGKELSVDDCDNVGVKTRRSSSSRGGGKAKGKVDFGFEEENEVLVDEEKQKGGDNNGKGAPSDVVEDGGGVSEAVQTNQSGIASGRGKGRRRYSGQEKGKEKLVVDDVDTHDALTSDNKMVDSALKTEVKISVDSNVVADHAHLEENVGPQQGMRGRNDNKRVSESRMEQFRHIARRSASRFAHFDNQDVEEIQMGMPSVPEEVNREIEDWPGPFSTAMKIIRDRAEKLRSQQRSSTAGKTNSAPIMWIPKGRGSSKRVIPLLQELCMTILAKNADAITSLDHVPDALKHKLSRVLCDSRRMNSHFLDLLLCGSPTEIRLSDCSWLTEEQFSKSFEGRDISNLTVLQLDNCGRCMADYMLHSTLARAENCLPMLTTFSVSGACRLSDVGLSTLVSSAPALRSINLSQCSLLNSASIDTLANHLGSVLRELYLDDCQCIDPMIILPALKKLEHLEVLSLARMQMVCDLFVMEFIVARGHNMKELVLTDCVKLTDTSVKIIAETCSGLCALDLSNLCKLTDSSLGYLANGCRAIYTLKLFQNAFSDEAIAAYLEMSGDSLTELSLNNVKKVANCTAFSLARRSRKLQSLDLSWCRNLTDEAVGLIVDSCSSLRLLKLFGCTQITNVFLDGHSNPEVQIIGLKMSSVLKHLKVPDPQQGPLYYS